jgi:hypothetical protein
MDTRLFEGYGENMGSDVIKGEYREETSRGVKGGTRSGWNREITARIQADTLQ